MISASERRYNNKLFKELINIYDPVAAVLLPLRRRTVRELLRLPKGARVLDVACGTGTQALMLARYGFSVTGIDISSAMLRRASRKNKDMKNVTLLRADATKLPFQAGAFHATIVSFGLHDMPEAIRVSVLREMRRVTKQRGLIVVADYNTPRNGWSADVEHSISRLFESKYFESFIRNGLDTYLKAAKLTKFRKVVFLAGDAQLAVCRRR